MYLLNHAVHSEQSFWYADVRKIEATNVAINCFEMIMVFVDVSEQAGIFGCQWIWLRFSDFNLDGYPDIYVGMIFMKMIILNNGDGTLREFEKHFGHTSRFSME
jgi:hypothetical protein